MTAAARRSASPFGAIPEVLRVTFRQLLGRRRTILLALLCAIPVLIALLYVATGEGDRVTFVRDGIYDALVVTIILPIVAVLVGTVAFGAEIEDGTVVYLLAKPVARWQLMLAKLIGAGFFTFALNGLSVLLVGLFALLSEDRGVDLLTGFLVAAAVGSFCYSALFMTVSLFTRRALVIGFVYVLIWEAAVTTLMPGLSNLSIRRYMIGAASQFTEIDSTLTAQTAFLLVAILLVAATLVGVWRLSRFELPSSGD